MSLEIDPVTAGTAMQVTQAAVTEAKGLLGKFLGPSADELGAALADNFRLFRVKQQIRLLRDAKQLLADEGLDPKAVNLKTLVPLLEAAVLEEDEDMSKRWAALLASAANPANAQGVAPSFIEILKQLTPLEARLLDSVYQIIEATKIKQEHWSHSGLLIEELKKLLGLGSDEFSLAVDNLLRLRLLAFPAVALGFVDDAQGLVQLSHSNFICGTTIGGAFVKACRLKGPVPKGAESLVGHQEILELSKSAMPRATWS
jgi:hypothetical protein